MRRQNLSCDPCRSSKRRCLSRDGDVPQPPEQCRLCSKLGRRCTYDFSNAQRESKPPKRRLQQEAVARSTAKCDTPLFDRRHADETVASSSLTAQVKLNDAIGLPVDNEATIATWTTDSSVETRSASWLHLTGAQSGWRSHTTSELNVEYTRRILRDKQALIHTVTLGWKVNQYLCHSSNPFATPDEYLLTEDGVSDDEYSDQPSTMHPVAGGHGGNEHVTTYQTLNGMARLLDSFSDIYGSALSGRSRGDALKALDAVTQAWSTQWLLGANLLGTNASESAMMEDSLLRSAQHKRHYAESWKYAHTLLMKTKGAPSFTRSVAVFLFNMAEVPDCLTSSLMPGEMPMDLQDHALVQVMTLLQLVHDFTTTLPEDSIHRKSLENAGRVIYWYAYVRDTSVAIQLERQCILDTVRQMCCLGASTEPEIDETTTGISLDTLCRYAAAKNIALKRAAMMLRDLSKRSTKTSIEYAQLLQQACSAVECFNARAGASLEARLAGDASLSLQMEGCIAHLLLHWNYGVLMLVEYARSGSSLLDPEQVATVNTQLSTFEEEAMASVLRLAARFTDSALDNDSDDRATSSQYPSVIARNSNIPLVTAMLSKFLTLAVANQKREASTSQEATEQISLLLKSLLSLSRAMRGSAGPQAALRSLMAQHPDQLMGIWASHVTA